MLYICLLDFGRLSAKVGGGSFCDELVEFQEVVVWCVFGEYLLALALIIFCCFGFDVLDEILPVLAPSESLQ